MMTCGIKQFSNIDLSKHKFYYINLKHREDRKKHLLDQFKLHDIVHYFQRYEAINGKDIDLRNLSPKILHPIVRQNIVDNKIIRYGVDLTYGSLGCALSHYNIYQETIKNNYESVLILEDDINIDKKFIFYLENIIYQLDFSSFDILYLGSHNLIKTKSTASENINRVIGNVFGTFGMVVSNIGCKKLCDFLFPISTQIDSEISNLINQEKINVFSLRHPIVFSYNNFGTDIQGMQGCKISRLSDEDIWKNIFLP